jgi:hypothetical protein
MWDTHTNSYYIASQNNRYDDLPQIVLLHRIIMNAKKGQYIDHISHNRFDNRERNLRESKNEENTKNRKGKNKNNKSGYRNVFWSTGDNRWLVVLQIEGKSKCFGRFKKDEVDKAGELAEEMRQKYYKEFAGKS